jgi:hypothetical protein
MAGGQSTMARVSEELQALFQQNLLLGLRFVRLEAWTK